VTKITIGAAAAAPAVFGTPPIGISPPRSSNKNSKAHGQGRRKHNPHDAPPKLVFPPYVARAIYFRPRRGYVELVRHDQPEYKWGLDFGEPAMGVEDQQQKVIKLLETALMLANDLAEADVAYRIERALDEARSRIFAKPEAAPYLPGLKADMRRRDARICWCVTHEKRVERDNSSGPGTSNRRRAQADAAISASAR